MKRRRKTMTNNYFNHSTVLSVLRLQLYFVYQSLKVCVCVREIILCMFLLCIAKVRNKKKKIYVISDA